MPLVHLQLWAAVVPDLRLNPELKYMRRQSAEHGAAVGGHVAAEVKPHLQQREAATLGGRTCNRTISL